MARTHRSPVPPARPDSGTDRLAGWASWVLLAGIVLFTVGLFNIVEWLVAMFNGDPRAVRPSGLVLHVDYTTWGWGSLIVGALLALAGYGVLARQAWARAARSSLTAEDR